MCTFLQTPAPSLATLGHVYSAPSRCLPCPALGGTDPPVCPASSPQDVPETLSLSDIPSLRPLAGQDPGVQGSGGGAAAWGGSLSGRGNEGGGRGSDKPNRFRLIPAPPLTSWVPARGRRWTE
jgi:hypothetical protein